MSTIIDSRLNVGINLQPFRHRVIDDWTDPALVRAAEAETARMNQQLDDRRNRDIFEREQRRRSRLSEIEGQRTGTLDELNRQREAEHERRRDQFASDLEQSESALAQARREWQQAIELAARKRDEAGAADLSDYRAGFLTGRKACQWIVDTLNGPEPAAIWGLSDGDVAWWCYDALSKLPEVDRRWLDKLSATSGLHQGDRDELWPLFDEACRNSPVWLCQYNWDIAERFTHAALRAHGVGIDRDGFRYAGSLKRKIDCNAVYRLMDHGLWWPLLEGQRLAIVSGHADEFATRLVGPEFVKATGGGEVTWTIATKITCPDKTVAKRAFWKSVRNELFAIEWDLLLCSAGSLSAVICEAARQRGRSAIDVGSVDQRTVLASAAA